MKKLRNPNWFLVLITMASLAIGCKTQLAPGGAYKGDQVLYNADKVITGSYDILHSFVQWEYDNRAAVPKEVSQAADLVRANAQRWTQSAVNLREAYATQPNAQNKDALTSALTVLQQALNEAVKYMATTTPASTNSPPASPRR